MLHDASAWACQAASRLTYYYYPDALDQDRTAQARFCH
jgi:hypothetical protein